MKPTTTCPSATKAEKSQKMFQNILYVCLLLTYVTAQKRLDMDNFHHLGNFLRSMQKFNELDYLYKPFQQYIVQRSIRGAKQEVAEDDEEEQLFFSLFSDYGQTNLLGADWTLDDIGIVKTRCTSLVKLMNKRRRLEEQIETGSTNTADTNL